MSSVEGLVPPIDVPIVITGSTIVVIVELTVVVVPLTVRFPLTAKLPENVLSPAIICESGEIKPVTPDPANGMLNVCVDPEDEMLNELPPMPVE